MIVLVDRPWNTGVKSSVLKGPEVFNTALRMCSRNFPSVLKQILLCCSPDGDNI